MAKDATSIPQAPQQAGDTGNVMKKFMIYKHVKKTNLNPEGKKLLMVTFAPSMEAACELAREMIDAEDGPRFEVKPV